ncbi:MAG TPA: alpha-galactosidase [Candidatus Acidoferrales bacterium]|nr:alpha-galactosidase [Candidatus Acidoferrales bacterium]
MRVSLRDGRLDFEGDAERQGKLTGLRPEVIYGVDGARRIWRPALRVASGGAASAESRDGLVVELGWEVQQSTLVLRCRLRNEGSSSVRLSRLAPVQTRSAGDLQLGDSAAQWGVLRNGYQSWTGTRSFRPAEVDYDPWSTLLKVGLIDLRNPSPERSGAFRSDMFGAVGNLASGESLVAGFLGCNAFGGIEVSIANQQCTHFAATFDYDEITLAPGREMETDPLWLAFGDDVQTLLKRYADASGAALHARVPERNPVGWCSWYYYFTGVSEAAVLENLQALSRMRQHFPCDYVQIDDGYQTQIGDWLTANAKFPKGMKWIAEQIRSAGFDAGIWTAPFIARSGSQLLRDHPDWFVRNENGGLRFALWNPLWGFGNCYALDTTHPAALDWLRQTFRTIADDWGYRVLKLDFLYAAALPGLRHDPQVTRAQALRGGLEAIREAAGDAAFLLGCGCPLGPAIGVVDAMRIGPDVAPFWSNFASRTIQRDQHGLATKHAIMNTLTRAFLHRRWWLNDPDCLMVRDTRTSLSLDEVRTLSTAIAVTDGMVVLSDRVAQLPQARLDFVERTLQVAGGNASAVDLLANGIPEVVVSHKPDETVLAVFNFRDESRRKRVDLRALGVTTVDMPYATEFWTGDSVSIADGVANFGAIPPHACRVLRFPRQP